MGRGGHEVKIVEPVYGIYTGVSDDFQRGPLKNMSRCLKANQHDAAVIFQEPMIVASRGRNTQNPSDRTPSNRVEQRLEPNSECICNTLTSVQKDNLALENCLDIYNKSMRTDKCCGTITANGNTSTTHCGTFGIVQIKQATKDGYIECKLGGVADLSYPESKTRRGRVQDNGDTCPTLTATETGVCRIETPYRIRKLTPLECWRLMGFTDEDFHKAEKVNSNTQLYKQAGNSIVVNVLEGIFRQMLSPIRS